MGVLADDLLHIWRIDPDATPEARAALAAVLGRAEQDRCANLGSALLRHRFIVVHGTVRVILGDYLGIRPERLRLATGPWGKPSLAAPAGGLQFSLSHAPGFTLLAVGSGRAVGIDVARARPGFPAAAFAARYFPAAERDQIRAAGQAGRELWMRCWARKEAWVKAAGVRLALGLALPVREPGPSLCVRDPAGRVPGPWTLLDLPAPGGHAVCAAMAGNRPFRAVAGPVSAVAGPAVPAWPH